MWHSGAVPAYLSKAVCTSWFAVRCRVSRMIIAPFQHVEKVPKMDLF